MKSSHQHEITHLFGLIGFPLGHSFSKKYFSDKFDALGLIDYDYSLFPLEDLDRDFPGLLKSHPNLKGLNVTIPFKEKVFDFLDHVDSAAEEIGAVNCIKIEDGLLTGYNTDIYGFRESLLPLLKDNTQKAALILGTGGSAKAIVYVLKNLGFSTFFVSRNPRKEQIAYSDLDKDIMGRVGLIVNCTPLGMYPAVENCPPIPYSDLSQHHIVFDLVYNPEKTLFLQLAAEKKCTVKNGLEMLSLQAEKSWEIWKNLENQYPTT